MNKPQGKDANIVIYCSDPRVVRWFHDKNFCKKLDLAEAHSVIAETGGIKFFLNEGLMASLFKQLKILIGHFSPEKIVLLNHLDCGYYKSLEFTDLGKMREEMIKDIQLAAREIKDQFSDILIEGYILNHDDGTLETIKLN